MTGGTCMPLLDEGTDCWEHADRVSDDVYEITTGNETADEHWAFPLAV